MIITKELLHSEFKEVTKKDEKSKKPSYKHRIAYLQSLKEDYDQNPKNFNNVKVTSQQLQNLIDDWSAPKPIDAFYKRVFGMTYAEKKSQEDLEYNYVDKKTEDKKPTEETQSIH